MARCSASVSEESGLTGRRRDRIRDYSPFIRGATTFLPVPSETPQTLGSDEQWAFESSHPAITGICPGRGVTAANDTKRGLVAPIPRVAPGVVDNSLPEPARRGKKIAVGAVIGRTSAAGPGEDANPIESRSRPVRVRRNVCSRLAAAS